MKSLILAAVVALAGQPGWAAAQSQVVELQVTENGFEPSSVDVKPGTPVILKVTRKTDSTCATQIKIDAKKITKELPLNKTVTVNVGKLEKGEIRFGCGMDMITGKINVR